MIEFQPIPQHHSFQDLTGQPFGRWTVLGYAGRENKRTRWWCKCACGTVKKVLADTLKSKAEKNASCGCYRRESVGDRFRTHALTGTKEHRIWRNMLNRCTNPNVPEWPNYGGRGITVCDRWRKFENFLADMGNCPPGLSLDRRDNDGSYEPANCGWATKTEQIRNRRNTVLLTHNGETKPLCEWAEQLGIKPALLYSRLDLGWTVDRVLTQSRRRKSYRTPEQLKQAAAARYRVHCAIKAGKLVKPSHCEHPGCLNPKIQGHHHRGYEHPLDVLWLCLKHHREDELRISGIPLAAPESYA